MPDSVDFFLYDYCVYGWFTPDDECLYISCGPGSKAVSFKSMKTTLHAIVHSVPFIRVRYLAWCGSREAMFPLEDEAVQKYNPRLRKPYQIYRNGEEGPVPSRPLPFCLRKERPRCRKVIIKYNLRPEIRNGTWDGWSCLGPDCRYWGLTANMGTQMRKMAAEGYWGEVKIVRMRRKRAM